MDLEATLKSYDEAPEGTLSDDVKLWALKAFMSIEVKNKVDLEMSFVEQQDVFDTVAPVIAGVFEEFGDGRKVDAPGDWPQIPYASAMLKYGTDKPDLRNPIEMQDVSEHFRGSGFAIFAKLLEQDGTEIRAIPAPTGGSRKFCDRMNAFAQKEGLP